MFLESLGIVYQWCPHCKKWVYGKWATLLNKNIVCPTIADIVQGFQCSVCKHQIFIERKVIEA